MQHASSLFRLLADHTRLRLLHLLTQDRFNVSELTAILAMATKPRRLLQTDRSGVHNLSVRASRTSLVVVGHAATARRPDTHHPER